MRSQDFLAVEQVPNRRYREAVSHCYDLVTHKMQPDCLGADFFIKMATDRVSYLFGQFIECIGFGEDRFAQRMRRKPAFRRFFNHKNKLFH